MSAAGVVASAAGAAAGVVVESVWGVAAGVGVSAWGTVAGVAFCVGAGVGTAAGSSSNTIQ